jgi:predicted phage-related endonuclease
MSTNELTTRIRELRELQALIDEAQTEVEAIKDAIKAHMGDTEELRAGEYKVTWKTVSSSRVDTSALKRELPEVAERYTLQTSARRFQVA